MENKASKLNTNLFLALVIQIFVIVAIIKTHLDENKREAESKAAAAELINKCQGTVEERISCLSDKLRSVRKAKTVQDFYYLDENSVMHDAGTFIQGDIVRIKRMEGRSMTACLSNTFFSDWKPDYIYLSLDADEPYFICNGGPFYASGKTSFLKLLTIVKMNGLEVK